MDINDEQIKKLQTYVAKECIKREIDVATIDFAAELDRKINYTENKDHFIEILDSLQKDFETIAKEAEESQKMFEAEQEVQLKKEITEKKERLLEIISSSKEYQEVDVKKALEEYSIHSEKLILSTLIAVALRKNVINCGMHGSSKSWASRELLKSMGVDYCEIKGHQTPKSFFQNLKLMNGMLIVIDESANLLGNKEILNMLLSALHNERVVWENSKETDEIDKFVGYIIFNTNYLPDNPILKAVCDRTIFNVVKYSSAELKDKIKQSKKFVFDKLTWDKIKNNLFVPIELSEEEIDSIYEILDKIKIRSIRDRERFISFGKISKKLTGDLRLVEYWYKIDEVEEILENDGFTKKQKVEMIAKRLVDNGDSATEDGAKRMAYRLIEREV